jgi:hypothetical protein
MPSGVAEASHSATQLSCRLTTGIRRKTPWPSLSRRMGAGCTAMLHPCSWAHCALPVRRAGQLANWSSAERPLTGVSTDAQNSQEGCDSPGRLGQSGTNDPTLTWVGDHRADWCSASTELSTINAVPARCWTSDGGTRAGAPPPLRPGCRATPPAQRASPPRVRPGARPRSPGPPPAGAPGSRSPVG